jgi:hypothetical protein
MFLTGNECQITTVTIDTSGSTGNGTVTSNPSGINCTIGNSNGCSSEFEAGTTIVLTATPDTNSTFRGWSGPNASNCQEGTAQTTCTLNLTENSLNVTVVFNSDTTLLLTIDATSGSTGTGTVSSNPAGITCQTGSTANCSYSFTNGTSVVLTATPGENSIFQGWSVPGSTTCQEGGTQTTCTLSLSESQINVTAMFISFSPILGTWKDSYGNVFTVNPNGSVSVNSQLVAHLAGFSCTFEGPFFVGRSVAFCPYLDIPYNIYGNRVCTYYDAITDTSTTNTSIEGAIFINYNPQLNYLPVKVAFSLCYSPYNSFIRVQ